MRKLIILLSFVSLDVSAQDVIVKKDGSTILSKVLEVNQNDIKYKKHSNKNGPTYTINKSDIISINYENGEKDTFSTNNIDQNSGSEKSLRVKRRIRVLQRKESAWRILLKQMNRILGRSLLKVQECLFHRIEDLGSAD